MVRKHKKWPLAPLLALSSVALSSGLGTSLPAWAGGAVTLPSTAQPTGGTIVAGQATISHSAAGTTITQSSNDAYINWKSFNVGSGETVTFNQGSTSAIALNRVVTGNAADIEGRINATGQVWILSAGGVLFGKNAQVNVAGLLATTSYIDPDDFMAGASSGHYVFTGRSKASVVNQGVITTEDNGSVVLSGATVSNQGLIEANLGSVALGGATGFTVDFDGDNLLNYAVMTQASNASVANAGSIIADGGHVLMTTGTARKVADGVINMSGEIEATSATEKGGEVILGGDDITVAGKIDVSGAAGGGTIQVGNATATKTVIKSGSTLLASATVAGNGGSIETSGKSLTIGSSTVQTAKAGSGTAGTWTLDPSDLVIDSGAATTYDSELASGGRIVADSSGNIFVESALSWSTTAELDLVAAESIYVNAPITATNAGATFEMTSSDPALLNPFIVNSQISVAAGATVYLGANGWSTCTATGALCQFTIISDGTGLQNALNSGTGNYVLTNSVDASTLNGDISALNGVFEGFGHAISNISAPDSGPLFTSIGASSVFENVALNSETVVATGTAATGAVAQLNLGRIFNISLSDATIIGGSSRIIGGVVGINDGAISGVNVISGTMTGGGLSGGTVGAVAGINQTGGVIDDSTISGLTITVDADGSEPLGGLVGINAGLMQAPVLEGGLTINSGSDASTWGGVAGINTGTITGADVEGATLAAGDTNLDYGGVVGVNNGGTLLNVTLTDLLMTATEIDQNFGGVAGVDVGGGTIMNVQEFGVTIDNSGGTGSDYQWGGVVGSIGAGGYLTGISYGLDDINNPVKLIAATGDGFFGGVAGINAGTIAVGFDTTNDIPIGIDISGLVITGSSGNSFWGGIAGINTIGGVIGGIVDPFSTSDYLALTSITLVSGGDGFAVDNVFGGVAGQNDGSISLISITSSTIAGSSTVGSFGAPINDFLFGGVVGANDSTGSILNVTLTSDTISGGGSSTLWGGVAGANNGGDMETIALLGVTVDSSGGGGSFWGGVVGSLTGNGILNNISIDSNTDIQSGTGDSDWGGVAGVVDSGSTIENVTLLSMSVFSGGSFGTGQGDNTYGGVVGSNGGLVTNVTVGSQFVLDAGDSDSTVGGLIGSNSGTLSNTTLQGFSISGGSTNVAVGGAVGQVTNSGVVSGVTGTLFMSFGEDSSVVGGLVGEVVSGTVQDDYTMGSISMDSGSLKVGGLVGSNDENGTIDVAFSNMNITTGGDGIQIGGLAGYNKGAITDTYATGSVSGGSAVGGLVGQNDGSGDGSIGNSYSRGRVTASGSIVGGLVGQAVLFADVENSYWDVVGSGQSTSQGGTSISGIGQWMTVGPLAKSTSAWHSDANWTTSYPYPVLSEWATYTIHLSTATGSTVAGAAAPSPTTVVSISQGSTSVVSSVLDLTGLTIVDPHPLTAGTLPYGGVGAVDPSGNGSSTEIVYIGRMDIGTIGTISQPTPPSQPTNTVPVTSLPSGQPPNNGGLPATPPVTNGIPPTGLTQGVVSTTTYGPPPIFPIYPIYGGGGDNTGGGGDVNLGDILNDPLASAGGGDNGGGEPSPYHADVVLIPDLLHADPSLIGGDVTVDNTAVLGGSR